MDSRFSKAEMVRHSHALSAIRILDIVPGDETRAIEK